MQQPVDIETVFVRRMQAVTSADLYGASLNAASAQKRLERAIACCTLCPHQTACAAWLDTHATRRAAPPAFCNNAHIMGPSKAHI
ncbi:DUF6455 family protein [Pelagibacterium luteolum]|uniref:DUF6455 domain-containing protein n=1 Tax=Pelagibacterium luteolum TaxID=440168 RepID=A0A1G7WVN8_9HYPH|nr:DUF6455 family protein [Pelagibacterium luteolum]SDG76008.1 hypothetical protein SAMN04487974_107149 [Pelagibacterium luteolum]